MWNSWNLLLKVQCRHITNTEVFSIKDKTILSTKVFSLSVEKAMGLYMDLIKYMWVSLTYFVYPEC
jgi:hypothetical protein